MGDLVPAEFEPSWSDNSELATASIAGRKRDVVDHFGQLLAIPFPGMPSRPTASLPMLDIDVSRTDVVSDEDPALMHVGPYLLTVGTNQEMPESQLTSIDELEAFGRAVIAAAQRVRTFLADESGTIAEADWANVHGAVVR